MASDKAPQAPERIYDLWAKRNVHFEVDLEDAVIRQIADYGSGANKYNTAKGYSLGGGYEVYILAFFIGLYSNCRRPLSNDTKTFGQPIQYWGNIESRGERKAYPKLREYVFAAAIARTDLDLLALEKDKIALTTAVSAIIKTMDEYANYGLHVLQDKLEEDKHYFTSNTAFLSIFMPLFQEMNKDVKAEDVGNNVDEPESLD